MLSSPVIFYFTVIGIPIVVIIIIAGICFTFRDQLCMRFSTNNYKEMRILEQEPEIELSPVSNASTAEDVINSSDEIKAETKNLAYDNLIFDIQPMPIATDTYYHNANLLKPLMIPHKI